MTQANPAGRVKGRRALGAPGATRPGLVVLPLVMALAVLTLFAGPARAGAPASTLTELLDRAQIENLLAEYYGNLGGADRGMGTYYTADGILDVNGMVARGPKAIEELYKRTAEGSPRQPGKFNMLLTNPRIIVHGDSATVDVIWTGVDSPTPESRPRFIEQGREHDELVKLHGRWYFKHRIITSDGGLPKMFEKTYRRR